VKSLFQYSCASALDTYW